MSSAASNIKMDAKAKFPTPAPLVWINGFPGVGKLTIAKELVQICGTTDAVLVDNHQLIDPVAAIYARDDPKYYPARRAERQRAFERWVSKGSKKPKLIVFTDFQSNSELGCSVAAEYAIAAEESGRLLIPIYLDCDETENLKRAVTTERIESGTTKLVDADFIKGIFREYKLFVFDIASEIRVDVTNFTPPESARLILNHILAACRI